MRWSRVPGVIFATGLLMVLSLPDAVAAPPHVQIERIRFDPPGLDGGSNASLNRETVVIANTGSSAATLGGWTLRDREGHTFRFPDFSLAGGRRVIVHTGRGVNGPGDLYMGFSVAMWNNDGDTATLTSVYGGVADRCTYSGSGTVARC